MNVTCPSCETVYRVDPARVPAGGVRARCAVCSGVFLVDASSAAVGVRPPAPPPHPPSSARPLPPPPPQLLPQLPHLLLQQRRLRFGCRCGHPWRRLL